MTFRVLLAGLLLAVMGDAFSEDWLVLSGRSYHFYRNGQEEWNYGMGLERRYSERWAGSVGVYRNSTGEGSLYGAAGLTVLRQGSMRFGVMGGLVTGYYRSPCPLGGLTGSLEGRKLGLNVIFIPVDGGVLFAQLKFRLD